MSDHRFRDEAGSLRLRDEAGSLLRQRRKAAGLTQEALARAAGVSQAMVSKVERGAVDAGLDLLDGLFAALDLRLRVGAERAGAHLQSDIDRTTLASAAERLEPWSRMLENLAAFGVVFEGPVAAALHGVPIPVEAVDIVIAPHWLDAFTEWLDAWSARRWSARWQEFCEGPVDPRRPGPLRWQVFDRELRGRIARHLPPSITIQHEGRPLNVTPLADLELADPLLAVVLARYRESGGAAFADPAPVREPVPLPPHLLRRWARRSP